MKLEPTQAEYLAGSWVHKLSSSETKRLANFGHSRRKLAYLGSRFLLDQLLTETTTADYELDTLTNGRPVVLTGDQSEVFCSVSHSNDVVAVALNSNDRVGLDVEIPNAKRDVTGLIQAFFGEEDNSTLNSMSHACRETWFYQNWCAREAILKHRGAGSLLAMLNKPLRELWRGHSASARLQKNDSGLKSNLFVDVRWREHHQSPISPHRDSRRREPETGKIMEPKTFELHWTPEDGPVLREVFWRWTTALTY